MREREREQESRSSTQLFQSCCPSISIKYECTKTPLADDQPRSKKGSGISPQGTPSIVKHMQWTTCCRDLAVPSAATISRKEGGEKVKLLEVSEHDGLQLAMAGESCLHQRP